MQINSVWSQKAWLVLVTVKIQEHLVGEPFLGIDKWANHYENFMVYIRLLSNGYNGKGYIY